jgi:hypothetical protein
MFPGVAGVRHVRGHVLEIRFTNGERHRADFADELRGARGVVGELRDVSLFTQAQADPECRTLVWPNGADFCPDIVYWLATGKAITWATDPKYHRPPAWMNRGATIAGRKIGRSTSRRPSRAKVAA